MQFTKTLDDVREQVAGDDAGKWDAIVPLQMVSLQGGRLVFPQATADGFEGGISMTSWAAGQACQRLGLPAAYFKRCPAHLQDANFNYWVRSQEIGRRLIDKSDKYYV